MTWKESVFPVHPLQGAPLQDFSDDAHAVGLLNGYTTKLEYISFTELKI